MQSTLGLGWIQSPTILNFFLDSFHYFFEVEVPIVHIHSITSDHTCIMKDLSKNWLEPGTTDPKSGMFAPRPILEKAINFWSGLLKFKFQAFFTKKYDNKLHEIYKKNQKKIVIKLSALLIHSCWNCSNKDWGGCYDNRALRLIGLTFSNYSSIFTKYL